MNGAVSTAQLMGGVRRLAALAHSARDEDTVLRALRYELQYALNVEEVRFQMHVDETWPSLPLIVDGRRRGVLVFVSHASAKLSDEQIEIAAALIEAAAAVLALQEARQAARVDSLTGALNHGAMIARLEEEIHRAQRYRMGLACLIIDLDDFKSINDKWGHATGDSVLRQVATLLRTEFRSHDQVARYGGDEFVVVLPDLPPAGALPVAERVVLAVQKVGSERWPTTPVTASIGVAVSRSDDDVASLLRRADTQAYAAKRAGGNRVALTGDHGATLPEGSARVG